MTFLIVSDTHGRYERLRQLCEKYPNADALIFLGDGLSDLDRAGVNEFGFTVFSVRGNWDSGMGSITALKSKDELTRTFEGVTFYAIHGHTKGVKNDIRNAIYAAEENNADVLFYGHTHTPHYTVLHKGEYDLNKTLHVFNPGSLANYEYGTCIFENGEILLSHEIL